MGLIKTGIRIHRTVALPSGDTFDCVPIGDFVRRYLRQSTVSVDIFARNKGWATFTNDLNPGTSAMYHLEALQFLTMLKHDGIAPDLVIFDPPYSRRQVMEMYAGIGKQFTNADSQYFSLNWRNERKAIDDILLTDGVVLSFGWNSNGMQQSGSYKIEEIMIVAHRGAHHDTICIAERKVAHQHNMFVPTEEDV